VSPTPPSLLYRLSAASDDTDAWRRFYEIYRPLLSGWLRRYALQASDADDLIQDILEAARRKLPDFRYDPARGHFRGWLRRVMINRLREFWRARKRERHFVEPILTGAPTPPLAPARGGGGYCNRGGGLHTKRKNAKARRNCLTLVLNWVT
jgi:DNA-directed RNA polymerase specialized sigma24 family protein